jgi:hypothetical protein
LVQELYERQHAYRQYEYMAGLVKAQITGLLAGTATWVQTKEDEEAESEE